MDLAQSGIAVEKLFGKTKKVKGRNLLGEKMCLDCDLWGRRCYCTYRQIAENMEVIERDMKSLQIDKADAMVHSK